MHTCVHCQSKLKHTKITPKEHSFGFWFTIKLLEAMAILPLLLLFILLDRLMAKIQLFYHDAPYSQYVVFGALIVLILVYRCLYHAWKHCYMQWKPRCMECGYSLMELESDSCPECGMVFDRETQWFKTGVEKENKSDLPLSVKHVLIMTVCLMLLSIVVTTACSLLTYGQLINIGWPMPIYNYRPGYEVDYVWQWLHPFCDLAAYVFLALGLEYIYQWQKRKKVRSYQSP